MQHKGAFMRNIIQTALREHLDQYAGNHEKLNELYQAFKDSEESTTEAITLYADLVFDYGVDKDSTLSKINANTVIGIGLMLKSLANDLNLAQYRREYSDIALDRLTQGGNDES